MSLRIKRLSRLGRAQPHGLGLGGTLGQLGLVPGAHVREPVLRRGALCAQLGLEVVTRLLQHLPLTLHPLQLAPARLLLLELRQLLLELLRLLDLFEQLCGVSCLQLLVGRACTGCSAATTLQRGQPFLQRLVLAGQLLHGFEHADVLGAQHLLRCRHGADGGLGGARRQASRAALAAAASAEGGGWFGGGGAASARAGCGWAATVDDADGAGSAAERAFQAQALT